MVPLLKSVRLVHTYGIIHRLNISYNKITSNEYGLELRPSHKSIAQQACRTIVSTLIQKLVLNTLQHATNLSASSHFTLQGFSTTKVRFFLKVHRSNIGLCRYISYFNIETYVDHYYSYKEYQLCFFNIEVVRRRKIRRNIKRNSVKFLELL